MASPSSSYPVLLILLLLALVAPSCSRNAWYFDHIPRPWVFVFDEDTEDFRQRLRKPWIRVDHQHLPETLANTTGFRIASAILEQQRCRLTHLLVVEEIYRERFNETKLFIPNCDAITIYIRPLENETEILENYPGIIDDIRSGGRLVAKRLVRKVNRFDGGGNVSVSRPFIYSDEEGAVAVHGVRGGFGDMESQIKNLTLYGPHKFHDYSVHREGLRAGGVSMFDSVEFPLTNEEEAEISKLSMRTEMVIVANNVPTPQNYDCSPDSEDCYRLTQMYGAAEKAIAWFKQRDMPYGMTLLYSLHF